MSKSKKRLMKMKENPKDWRIEDLKSVADEFGIEYRQRGSHVTFRAPTRKKLTVPAHKPIRSYYTKQFVILVEELMEDKHGE